MYISCLVILQKRMPFWGFRKIAYYISLHTIKTKSSVISYKLYSSLHNTFQTTLYILAAEHKKLLSHLSNSIVGSIVCKMKFLSRSVYCCIKSRIRNFPYLRTQKSLNNFIWPMQTYCPECQEQQRISMNQRFIKSMFIPKIYL